jgi:hypothetical protein
VRFGTLVGRSGRGLNNVKQGKRHSRLHFAHGSVTKEIRQMTGSVYAKDEEDLVAARDPDVLAGSGRPGLCWRHLLLAVVSARSQR